MCGYRDLGPLSLSSHITKPLSNVGRQMGTTVHGDVAGLPPL